MPMLADLDTPEPRRGPGLVVGVLVAVPLALLVGWLTMPRLMGAILGGAAAHDARAQAAASYMAVLCLEPDPARDQELCGCALGTEFPGMDCMDHFARWSVARHVEQCRDDSVRAAALSFCACEESAAEQVERAAADEGDAAARSVAGRIHPRCRGLDDAIELPALGDLGR